MTRILIVEDNAALAAGIEFNLKLEDYEVRVACTGPAGIRAAVEWVPELVILDLMLPGADGYAVLANIRQHSPQLPVIILSARHEEQDRVRGFRLDADQFMNKPFSILELVERVAALLRRSAHERDSGHGSTLTFGDVGVDLDAHTVVRAGGVVTLTPKAYELLVALVRRKGKAASRADLLREVWGYAPFVVTRTVDSHIAELRRKLDNPDNPRHFITVWKLGYRFVP